MRIRSQKKKSQDFEFIGLKKYTHDQRTEIIKKFVVPILKKELGKNLIAVAADGSYARNEDVDFSDIELIIFVKNKNNIPRGFGKIIDGVLVEGMFMTVGDFYREVLDVNDEWYISGSDRLKAITNPSFIEKVKKYSVNDLSDKCFEFSKKALFENQECFGKLFNVIKKKNKENVFPVLMYVVMQVLKMMSFINKTPYKTLSSFITQAKEFKIKPEGFDEFIELIVNGKYTNLRILEVRSKRLFVGIEEFFMRKMGRDIYDSDFSGICKK